VRIHLLPKKKERIRKYRPHKNGPFLGAPAVVEHAGLDDLGVQVALLARAIQDVLLDRARRHEHE